MATITINNKALYYQDQGQGFPLLFGHSYLWDHTMWSPQIKALSQNFRCITPDLWGHGQSDSLPKNTKTLTDLADEMLALMDALHIDQFAVIGLSVGGMWASELALQAPERILALTLMDTFVGKEPELSYKQYFAMLAAIEQAQAIPIPLLDKIVPLFFSPKTFKTQPDLIENFQAHLQKLSPEKLQSIIPLGRMIFGREDRLNKLTNIQTPTLIITGEDDIPRPVSEGKLMAGKLANASFITIEDAGHISTLEQPQHVNDALFQFLQPLININ
ncbi:alpha/beta fold hydrolase [Piscirickettsia salmonis]|uniref:alpha/beta fold hydrolase n=1 Tax=Piscirickettsia salmonis TaxID=1238 RepID=UPI000F091AE4|nr:2-succinyl-6-hydroxy-2,4-cyclohexadiene-1-carboxylate synthase [Piscirickettsiaceae bacterium NZ-RLO2]